MLNFRKTLTLLLATLLLLSSGFSHAESRPGEAQEIQKQIAIGPVTVEDPGTDFWRAVRQRDNNELVPGRTQMQNINSGVLINTTGEEWRQFRQKWLLPYGGYFLLGTLGFLGLLWLLIKPSKIPNGRSGKVITRMTTMQRVSHWFMAGMIGFLALTGLILLFGRTVLIPVFGADAFSPLASASKEGHNLFGPLLIVAILLMVIHYIRQNFPAKGDLKWLLTLGGKLSKEHPRVGYFNAGEKSLYWLTIIFSIVLIGSGLLLLFPYYQPTVDKAQLALIIHAIAALIVIAMAFGHIWMVRTVEGTLDAMTSGDVDENWAKEHHARWYEEQAEKNPESQSRNVRAEPATTEGGAFR